MYNSTLVRRSPDAPMLRLIFHLFLHFLIDPDAGVDRATSLGTYKEFSIKVLDPWPPGRIGVGGGDKYAWRLIKGINSQFFHYLHALFFSEFWVFHCICPGLIYIWIRHQVRIPGLGGHEVFPNP